MLFSISLFREEKREDSLPNVTTEAVYSSIPAFIFTNPQWFYHTEKHMTNILSTMLIGESYKAAWSKDESQYVLITRAPEPFIIIDDENAIRNRRSNIPLPISDDEEDKEQKYDILCARYLKYFADRYIELFQNNKQNSPQN